MRLRPLFRRRSVLKMFMLLSSTATLAQVSGRYGYYRDPAVRGTSVVFTAEGDL